MVMLPHSQARAAERDIKADYAAVRSEWAPGLPVTANEWFDVHPYEVARTVSTVVAKYLCPVEVPAPILEDGGLALHQVIPAAPDGRREWFKKLHLAMLEFVKIVKMPEALGGLSLLERFQDTVLEPIGVSQGGFSYMDAITNKFIRCSSRARGPTSAGRKRWRTSRSASAVVRRRRLRTSGSSSSIRRVSGSSTS